MTMKKDWDIEQADALYGVSGWGAGYFQIGENGNLQITPDNAKPHMRIDMQTVIDEIQLEGIQFPVVVRFHDILRHQVTYLNQTFDRVIEEAEYQAQYNGVYPVKVNQMREVVEEIVDAGEPYQYGLEAGSKAELIAVLAYNTNEGALTVLNGYKDDEFMQLAFLGQKLGRKVLIVIEKFSELILAVKYAKQMGVTPMLGLRAKMSVKGRGKWEGSGGDRAKFGLTIAEIIQAAEYLQAEGMPEALKLLHFHIGSQLTDIRAVKEAINEGALIYAEMHHLGYPIEYLDIGGGLGIDYDGSNSTSDHSRNYTIDEYVADVVYGIKEVCDLEKVPHPTIVSESGRAITAHHSCVITEVLGEIRPDSANLDLRKDDDDEHILLTNMRELAAIVDDAHNFQEVFNDATSYKEQAADAFRFRVLGLRELGIIETLYWQIMAKVREHYQGQEFVPEEVQELDFKLSSQYLCNFSIFQSAADTWAIDQILPVVPLTRLNERPTVNSSLVDITCDSDGKLDQFAVGREVTNILPLHQLKRAEPYYLGVFLTGAYQDVMGDMHNLFGRLNEVHIFSYDDDPQDFYIEEYVPGTSVQDVLSIMQYNPAAMAQSLKKQIDKLIASKAMRPREAVKWNDFYEDCLSGYTYMKRPKREG